MQDKAMSNTGKRVHVRTKLRARILLMTSEQGQMEAYTADISDGGLFVQLEGAEAPEVGSIVKVQVQDMPVEAPVLRAEVVRLTPEGVGLMFVEDAEEK